MSVSNKVSGFSILQSSEVSVDPMVLILGSAPSVKSLEKHQYYAHPQNSFWWIMSEIFNFEFNQSYQQKQQNLNQQGVVVWDVLASCHREGSLDNAIVKDSEVANDIAGFLQSQPSIKALICNGQKATKLLKKHHPSLFGNQYAMLSMPSTSPAHASMTKDAKLMKWQEIKNFC